MEQEGLAKNKPRSTSNTPVDDSLATAALPDLDAAISVSELRRFITQAGRADALLGVCEKKDLLALARASTRNWHVQRVLVNSATVAGIPSNTTNRQQLAKLRTAYCAVMNVVMPGLTSSSSRSRTTQQGLQTSFETLSTRVHPDKPVREEDTVEDKELAHSAFLFVKAACDGLKLPEDKWTE